MRTILKQRMEMFQFKWSRHSGLSRKIPMGEEMKSEGWFWMVLRSHSVFLLVISSVPHQNGKLTQRRTWFVLFSGHSQHLEQSEVLNTYLINGWIGGWLAGWMNVPYFLEHCPNEKFSLTLLGRLDSLLWFPWYFELKHLNHRIETICLDIYLP